MSISAFSGKQIWVLSVGEGTAFRSVAPIDPSYQSDDDLISRVVIVRLPPSMCSDSLHSLPCLAAAPIRLSLERYPPVRGRFPICFPIRFGEYCPLLVVFGTCHE